MPRCPKLAAACARTAVPILVGGIVLTATPAWAAPAAPDLPARITSAQTRVHQLDGQAEQAAERYNAGRIQLAAAQRRLTAAQRAATAARSRLADMQENIDQLGAAAYTGGGMAGVMSVVTGPDPQSVLNQLSLLDAVGAHNNHQLDAFHAAAAANRRAEAAARAAATARTTALRGLQADRQRVQQAAAGAQYLLQQLQAEQARLAATARTATARSAAAAREQSLGRQVTATAAARRTFAAATGPAAPQVATGVASNAAQVAVRTALAQLGKPYVWGAAGPGSFDCSGLTMFAYAAAGISLPHFTGAQWTVGRHVSAAELRPGDLVFFYSTLHHMGMYIGGGRFVHAPHTGDVVKIDSLAGYYTQNWAGAVRVSG